MDRLLFVYDLENDSLWSDGLQAALKLLESSFKIDYLNLQNSNHSLNGYDFVLGWGAFGSRVDNTLKNYLGKKGLCLGGNATPVPYIDYDIIFYETKWVKNNYLNRAEHKKTTRFVHAFGTNTQIYKPLNLSPVIDYLTIGAFALWKNQRMILKKNGIKMAIGQIQRGNLSESLDIIGDLMLGGCIISDMIPPKKLAKFYNLSRIVYLPCDIIGGGERAVLEAKACGIPVEVENDKLKEIKDSPILWDEKYYKSQLKNAIKYELSKK